MVVIDTLSIAGICLALVLAIGIIALNRHSA